MAHFLALDWDNREFHLVDANLGRGSVHVLRAIRWREDEPVTAANAEAFAGRLRERMKEAGIAAAPIIVGLGRDRVVVREVRFPQVSPDVEAPVVRNQIFRDLTESPDDVLFDYAPMPELSRNGERRALSLVVRKDMVQVVQTVCRVAGLKLVAVTARPFGIAACFKHLAGTVPQVPAPPSAEAVTAILTVTQEWAEFCAVRGDQLLFSRSMASGEAVLGEVRRNLAAYSGQPHLSFPRDAIQALYVSGNGENAILREKLQATLGIPVHGMDPFAKEERVQVGVDNRAGFAGAVGLLQLWSVDQTAPVNFVKPRESKPVANPARRRALVYGGIGTLAAAALIAGGFFFLNAIQADEVKLRQDKVNLDRRIKELQVDLKYLDALGEWNEGAIPLLDEIYDLAARAPYTKGFKVNKITMVAATGKGAAKSSAKDKDKEKDKQRYTAKMTIELAVETSKAALVQQFIRDINNDREKHVRCTEENSTAAKAGKQAVINYVLRVDIMRQPPSKYTTLISK